MGNRCAMALETEWSVINNREGVDGRPVGERGEGGGGGSIFYHKLGVNQPWE